MSLVGIMRAALARKIATMGKVDFQVGNAFHIKNCSWRAVCRLMLFIFPWTKRQDADSANGINCLGVKPFLSLVPHNRPLDRDENRYAVPQMISQLLENGLHSATVAKRSGTPLRYDLYP